MERNTAKRTLEKLLSVCICLCMLGAMLPAQVFAEVSLGFQQLSELMHLPGIDVLGPLPEAIQITTIFAGGVAAASKQPEAARALLAFLAAPETAAIKQANGMAPA